MQILIPLLLFLSNLLNYVDRQLFSALFPIIVPAFRLSDTLVGALGSSFTLTYLLAAPLAGYLSDRIHPRRVLATGILVFSSGMLICALAKSIAILFLGRALTGIGEAALYVVGPQSIGTERGVGKKLAVFLSAMPIGAALGFVFATHATPVSFRSILILPVPPGFFLSLLLFFLVFPFPEKGLASLSPFHVISLFRNDKSFLSLITVEGTNLFVLGGMSVWISLFLTREKHMPMGAASSMTGLALVTGGLLGILLSGLLCDHVLSKGLNGVFWVLAGSQGLSLIGIAIVLAAVSRPAVFGGLFLASLGLFGTNVPVLVALLKKSSSAMWGSVLGSVLFVSHLLGDLPSSTLIGLAASHLGLTKALALLLPLPIVLGIGAVGAVLKRNLAGETS